MVEAEDMCIKLLQLKAAVEAKACWKEAFEEQTEAGPRAKAVVKTDTYNL